jgi:hypothetical protein
MSAAWTLDGETMAMTPLPLAAIQTIEHEIFANFFKAMAGLA